LAVLAVAGLGAVDGAHAAVPDQLCREGAQAASYPSSDSLKQAAARTETLLAGRAGGDPSVQALALLELAGASAEPPSPESRAAYCAAAGEVMRVGSQGSQFQAQSYLLTAVRSAQQAGAQAIGSRAAYRLGMVSQAAPTVTGARGAGRRTRSTSTREAAVQTGQVERATRADSDACSRLLGGDVAEQSNATITYLSFECAAARAQAAGQADLAALAKLKLAGSACSSWTVRLKPPIRCARLPSATRSRACSPPRRSGARRCVPKWSAGLPPCCSTLANPAMHWLGRRRR
jgi:hypothetical protein